MPTKIFLTGVTGYIGGDIFYALDKAHPDYEYTLLVRSEEKGKLVKEKYPKVKLIYGSNHDSDIIEKAAAEADIVIHTSMSADDVPSAKAIAKGIAAGHSAEKPGFYLHICGTGILTWKDVELNRWGYPPLKNEKGEYLEEYDDLKDIGRILSIPDSAIHRDVDKVVLAANDSPGVKTAIVGPPCIYGPGRGPDNTRSLQVYAMTEFALKEGFVPVVKPVEAPKETGEAIIEELTDVGKTEWDGVHVHDLSTLMVSLVEAAQDPAKNADPEVFGAHTYYFCEAGSFKWGDDVAKWVADQLVKQGFMAEPKIQPIKLADVGNKWIQRIAGSWGLNSKSHASRARKYLGWKPTSPSLKEAIPEIVTSEAKLWGKKA